jgi:hypothetical protein
MRPNPPHSQVTTDELLAAFVRALGDVALNDLLLDLPVNRFDPLLDAAFPTQDEAAA